MHNKETILSDERRKFLPSFLGAIRDEAEIRGWLAILPFALLSCVAVAVGIAYYMPQQFWAESKRELSVEVFAGLLTFNGLILVLGWTAFGRIYDVLMRGEFGKYLMQNKLLNEYILHITFMHIFQIAAVAANGAGLIVLLLDGVPLIVSRIIFGAVLLFTMYAIKQAINAVTVMNDLIWQAAFFESNRPIAPSNVIRVRRE
jgi:hypothetical protein